MTLKTGVLIFILEYRTRTKLWVDEDQPMRMTSRASSIRIYVPVAASAQ
jgi:hypothetical protein